MDFPFALCCVWITGAETVLTPYTHHRGSKCEQASVVVLTINVLMSEFSTYELVVGHLVTANLHGESLEKSFTANAENTHAKIFFYAQLGWDETA